MSTSNQNSLAPNFFERYRKSFVYNIYSKNKKALIAILLTIVILSIGEAMLGNFFTVTQIMAILKLASFTALFSLAQMIVMATGGTRFDLSIGYAATLTAVLTAYVMDGQNANLWKAVLIAVGLGIAIGSVNGVFTSYIKLPPLVVTLATANILQGIVNAYSAGTNITGEPSPILRRIAAFSTGVVPNVFIILVIVAVIAMIILYKTKLGLMIFGVGMNETAAYLSGVNVKLVQCLVYVVGGVIACLTGLLIFGSMGIAFKDMASAYIFPSIIAVVIGGVSLTGGDGNYIAVIIGAVFLQALSNLLVALNLGDWLRWVSFGVLLYLLLLLYVSERRKR
jgi:ribose transport system permease protein